MLTPRVAPETLSCQDRRGLFCPASQVAGALLRVSSAVAGRGCLVLLHVDLSFRWLWGGPCRVGWSLDG